MLPCHGCDAPGMEPLGAEHVFMAFFKELYCHIDRALQLQHRRPSCTIRVGYRSHACMHA